MRAVEYRGSRAFEVVDRAPAPPAPGEVQVAVSYVGLCGTDLHVYLGDMDARVGRRAVIGHEMSGRVAGLGDDVEGLEAGRPVTVLPTRFCGRCRACEQGHSNVCYNMDFIGLDSPGALQELWNVPADLVVPLDESVDLRDAALTEPLAVAVHDVRRARIRTGESVLVVGGGPIGILIGLVAQAAGGHVVLSEPEGARREAAEELGIPTVDPTSQDPAGIIDAGAAQGGGADVVFEVSGAAAGMDCAVESLAAHGRLIQVAIHARRREVDLHRFFWRELEMYGARLYHKEDMVTAAELIRDRRVPVARLITSVVPMENTSRAFAELRRGSAMKILVSVDGGS